MSAPTWCHPDVRDRLRASCTCVLQANHEKFNCLARLIHGHVIIHVLDDLEGGVDAGGFRDRLHEGIVPQMIL